MFEGCGFEVINLGVDVSSDKFIKTVAESHADIMCMSALLTTTMNYMKVVIEDLKKAGLYGKVKVMVGGAPITASFARSIGADGYTSNANAAVVMAKQLIGVIDGKEYKFSNDTACLEDILVDWDDLNYSLGKGYKLEGDVLSIMLNLESQVSRICRPCYGYCIYPAEGVEEANIRLGGCSLHTGSIITPFLTGAEYFVLFVVTVGNEFENFNKR